MWKVWTATGGRVTGLNVTLAVGSTDCGAGDAEPLHAEAATANVAIAESKRDRECIVVPPT
jgi:hypothetical protein